jgi:PAS domain S-box-containing protein
MPDSALPFDFRELVELGDAIIVRDLDGYIRFWNQGAERLYGFTATEAVGCRSHALLQTVFPEPLDAINRTLAADGSWQGVLRHRTAAGREVIVGSRWVQRGGPTGVVLEINRDDTEGTRADQALRAQQQQFALMTSVLPLMVAHVDGEHRYKYVNRAYADHVGVEPDALIGVPYVQVIGEPAAETIAPYVERVLAGSRVEYESWVPYARIGRRYMRCLYAPELDDGGRPIGYIAAIMDETARKLAEDALAATRERFDFVADSAEIGVWSCDLPFDRLIWNITCKAHFGLGPDAEVTIETFYERMHPDDVAPTRRAIERSIETGTTYDVEYRTRQQDGSYLWIRALGRTEYDERNRPRRFEGITVNITPQKEAQEQLREADRRKDEFLATLAHELRNPLAPLLIAVRLLDGSADAARLSRVRGVIQRQVTHLVKLVDELLDMSRITQGKLELRREPTTINAALHAALEACERMVTDAGHTLDLDLPETPLYVDGDETRLAQLFLNLLSNAIKYTPAGGRIGVRAERAGDEIRVAIADNGIGIDADALAHVFDMFVQGETARRLSPGGLGIGLTLVKRLVELHGGRIAVQSDGRDRGSTFTVTLPAIAVPRVVAAAAAAAAFVPPTRVLIVDDNIDAADTLALMLRELGHDVRTAYDGMQALEEGDAHRPAAVLLDIGMPRLDGFEAARRMRQRPWGANALIVAMTGWGQPRDVQQSTDAGIDRHLTKPVEPAQVVALLQAAAQPRG